MISLYKRVAAWRLLICAGLLLLPAGAQKTEFLPDWVKADWDYWTQGSGRWITDIRSFRSEQEPYDGYGTEWKWGLGKKTLTGRLFAIRDGKEVGTLMNYRSYWHPGEQRLYVTSFGSDGTFGTGLMKATGDAQTESLQRFFDPGGSTFQMGHRVERRPGEAHIRSYLLSEDGTWNERRRYVWKLEK